MIVAVVWTLKSVDFVIQVYLSRKDANMKALKSTFLLYRQPSACLAAPA